MEPTAEDTHRFLVSVNTALEEFTGTSEYNLNELRGHQYYELFEIANELLKYDGKENIDTVELKRKFNEFFGVIRRIDIRFQSPESKHPMDYIVDVVRSRLDPPRSESSLTNTKFLYYRSAALELARKVQDAGKSADVRTLYKEVPKNELQYILHHAGYLVKKLGILEEQQVRITTGAVERYWQLFFDMCGHLERIVVLLIGIKKILDNEPMKYVDLKMKYKTFGNNIQYLREQPLFQIIVEPIEPIIKNAISHASRIILPSQETITFNDLNKSVTYSFADFIQKTRELAAAMVVASHVDSAILLPDLEKFRDFIKS